MEQGQKSQGWHWSYDFKGKQGAFGQVPGIVWEGN